MSLPPENVRLQMEHISKHFGGSHALRDVTFGARAGEILALCGENGAGKSTLAKILGGVHQPEGGVFLL